LNVLVDPFARPVIAHRGDSAHAPENTIESFAMGLTTGADALELDVRLSRDDHIVVIHDPDVDRTTDGHGAVASMTLSELRSLDAGARFTADGGSTFPFRGCGIRIPTLDEILTRFPNIPVLIEVKESSAAKPAAEVVRRHGAVDRVILASELSEAMERSRAANMITGASRRDAVRLLRRACFGFDAGEVEYRALCVAWRLGVLRVPIRRMARAARAADVATHVWTVNSEAVAERLWRAGVNGIVTDDPSAMLRLRASLAE